MSISESKKYKYSVCADLVTTMLIFNTFIDMFGENACSGDIVISDVKSMRIIGLHDFIFLLTPEEASIIVIKSGCVMKCLS